MQKTSRENVKTESLVPVAVIDHGLAGLSGQTGRALRTDGTGFKDRWDGP